MVSSQWTHLIRFVSKDGKIYQGEPILNSNGTWPSLSNLEAKVITGDVFKDDIVVTNKVLPVIKLLTPLAQSQVPIIRGIGLNYRKHAIETKQKIPEYPVLFIKPSTTLQDPFEPIKVPLIATNNQADYEAELVIVIKKLCRDVSKENALDYVLGYTAANDVSARKWQGQALNSGQWCFSKGFDTFSPIGPALVSPTIIPNPNALKIRTILNGRVLQNSNTSDMIFDVATLISFLSQGTTLQPGSLIFTGTPEGVGFARNPPIYLQDRDQVSIEIENIGVLTNTVEYEHPPGVTTKTSRSKNTSSPFFLTKDRNVKELQYLISILIELRLDGILEINSFSSCIAKRSKNAFKKMRTIRHPDLLRYIDGVETDSYIYIVTDHVSPLKKQSASLSDSNLKLWGLYKIANALKFLNNDCSMIHGNVHISSIFTNKAGEWKLGGFELMSSSKEEDSIIYTCGGYLPDSSRYASPEIAKNSWSVLRNHDIWVTDSWNYGTLIYEVYNGAFTSIDQLERNESIPQAIFLEYRDLINPNPQYRASVSTFMENGLRPGGIFHNDLVQVNLFLENMNIKEASEKIAFIKKLNECIDTFPENICKYKILPELLNALEYGAGGAKVLGPIIKIGKTLPQDEYDLYIVTAIVKMFALPDRNMRLNLLENLPGFIERINSKTVTDKIFPHMATGFTDTAPIIREMTVKSMLLLVPKISEKVVNNDLLRYLAKLQMDEEPGIRTNTTICLGKISKYLNESTRSKILVPAFTRSLRDPFPQARAASLMALTATSEYYDKVDCASKVLPCVSMILIDTEKPVRIQAFKTLDAFVKRLEKLVISMPDTAVPPPTGIAGIAQASGVTGVAVAGATTVAGVIASAAETWGGRAVTSLSKKFVGPGDMGNVAEPSENNPTSMNGIASLTKPTTEVLSPTTNTTPNRTSVPESVPPKTLNGWENNESLIDLGGNLIHFEAPKLTDLNGGGNLNSSYSPALSPVRPLSENFIISLNKPKDNNVGATTPMKLGSHTKGPSNSWLDFENDFFNFPTNAKNSNEWGGFQSLDTSPISLSNPVLGTPNFGVQNGGSSLTTSMKLGSNQAQSLSEGWNFDGGWENDEDNWGSSTTIKRIPPPPSPSSTTTVSREVKAAELNRKREERRQRMDELREQKKRGALGARKI
ncbi:hypothetical protein G9A89_022011 [Geosiphon pyriformis]|nr:hypothetical protein G9A89_022011 [Geosiphon pyriformis]